MSNEITENKNNTRKKNKKSKKSKLISFDEELVPKHVADKIIAFEQSLSLSTKKGSKTNKRVPKSEDEASNGPKIREIEQDNVESANKQKRQKHDTEEHLVKKKKKKKRNSTPDSTVEEAGESLNEEKITEIEQDDAGAANKEKRLKNDNEEALKKKKKKKRNSVPELTVGEGNGSLNKEKTVESESVNEHNTEENLEKKKKKKKRNSIAEASVEGADGEKQSSNASTGPQKKESIRARKRKRVAKILEEKKLKTEEGLKEKGLNYLSKWKHCREEWKFEKLRQIWLQHNLYDPDKVPHEFWDISVEYFNNSKGKARDAILKDALKLIEENPDDEDDIKVKRARNIVQNLQE